MAADRAGLAVVSMNTRGIPVTGSQLADRYAAAAAAFEASGADVACLQEVISYRHLRLLTTRMPSFRHVSYRPALAGPAGGLVTLSRLPLAGTAYRRFPLPAGAPGLPLRTLLAAPAKGTLVTRLAFPCLCVVNVHPVANADGDWSAGSRFHPVHRAQLAAIASLVRSLPLPVIACGDLNVPRHNALFRDFVAQSGLTDAFAGTCPSTFHAAYLAPGQTPSTIDFILLGHPVTAESTGTLLADKVDLPSGPAYASDHIGLTAQLTMPA